jgi:hypothetical protein
MEGETVKVEWGPCCFCGREISQSQTDPCSITVSTVGEKWQIWYCHAGCFRSLLSDDPECQGLFDPVHF